MWVKKTCDSTIGSPKSKPWQYHNSARIQFTARCDVLRSEPPWSRNLNCWRDLVVHAASGSKVQAPSDWQAQMELYCTSYYLSFAPAASWPDYRGLPLLLQISSVTVCGKASMESMAKNSVADLSICNFNFLLSAVFSSKNSPSKLHYSSTTSNLLPHAWSIKCR